MGWVCFALFLGVRMYWSHFILQVHLFYTNPIFLQPRSVNQHTALVRWVMSKYAPISMPGISIRQHTTGLSGGLVLPRLAANRWLSSPSHERGPLAAFPLQWGDYCPPQMLSSFQLSQGTSTSPREPLYKRKAGIHIVLRVCQHLEVALPIGAILNPNN